MTWKKYNYRTLGVGAHACWLHNLPVLPLGSQAGTLTGLQSAAVAAGEDAGLAAADAGEC